jgi:protein O-mannosyl-transferase
MDMQWRTCKTLNGWTRMLSLWIMRDASVRSVLTRSWRSCLGMVLVFAGFFAAAVGLHYPGFHSRMVYDSEALLLGNAHVFSDRDILEVIGLAPQRPLFMASLYANYLVNGMDPASFRMVNAAILATAALALTMLISVLLRNSSPGSLLSDSQRHCLSILIGLIFVVHPLQKLVVLYIWQREAIMACFFYYAALAVYVAGRSGILGAQPRWYAATSLLVLGGILSKENVLSFPAIAMIVEWVLFRGSIRDHMKHSITIVLVVAVPFVIQSILQLALQRPETPGDLAGTLARLQSYQEQAGLTFLEIVLTQCRVWFSHVSTITVPFVQGTPLLRAEIVSRSLWEPPATMAAALGLVALAGAAVGLSRTRPMSALGIVFFMVALLPESLLIPQYLFCGYRAILPMAGVLMIAADGLATLLTMRHKRAQLLAVAAPLLAVLCLSLTTFSQAKRWNPFSFWQDEYAHVPEYSPDVERYPYADILTNYALELNRAGNYTAAIGLFERAAAATVDLKNDKYVLAKGNLGMTLIGIGKPEEGIRCLRDLVDRYPHGAWPRHNLGIALIRTGKREEGLRFLREAADLYPDDVTARVTLADILCASGNYAEAIQYYRTALKTAPRSGRIFNLLGMACAKSGDLGCATENYRKALQLGEDSPAVRVNLGTALSLSGKKEEAVQSFEQALALKQDFVPALARLGPLLLDLGRAQEAVTHLKRAASIVENDPEIYSNLGRALAYQGHTAEALAAFERALAIKPDHATARHNRDRLIDAVREGS